MDSLNRINYAWIDLVKNKSDPRVRDWFLMESPTPTFLLIAAYIYFVKVNVDNIRETETMSLIFVYCSGVRAEMDGK